MFIKFIVPAAVAAGMALSVGCGRDQASHGFMPSDLLASRLKLSTEQKQVIHGTFKRHQASLALRMEALAQTRNAAMDAGMDPAISQEVWRAQQEQVAIAAQAMAMEVRSTYLEARPALTEAQKAEGKTLLKKVHTHMEGMHGRHHDLVFNFVKNRLDLTDAQATKIRTILDRRKPALEAKRDTLHKAMTATLEAGLDPATPQAVLDQRLAAAKEAALALSSEVRAAYLEVVPQLTPDQREAAKTLVRDFRNAVDGVRKLALGF
jgi:hypothetical protein